MSCTQASLVELKASPLQELNAEVSGDRSPGALRAADRGNGRDLVNRGNEVASYCVGKPVTVRLVRLARWVSRGAGGATRRAPHAGRPRSPHQTGGRGWVPHTSARMLRGTAKRPQRTEANPAGPGAAPHRRWPPVAPHTWGCGHSDTPRR